MVSDRVKLSDKQTQIWMDWKVLSSGVSITCVCDPQGAIFNCFPTNYKRRGEVTASREASIRRAEVDQDERVEVILASTALVAVIALFLRWSLPSRGLFSFISHQCCSFLMYKLEKYLNKNELQVSIYPWKVRIILVYIWCFIIICVAANSLQSEWQYPVLQTDHRCTNRFGLLFVEKQFVFNLPGKCCCFI